MRVEGTESMVMACATEASFASRSAASSLLQSHTRGAASTMGRGVGMEGDHAEYAAWGVEWRGGECRGGEGRRQMAGGKKNSDDG